MQQTLTLRYVPEVDDLIELIASSPAGRRQRNRAVLNAGISLLLLWGCLVWLASVKLTPIAMLPALFLAMAFVTYVVKALVLSFRWGLRRSALARWRRSPTMHQTHEEEIGPRNVTLRVEGQTRIFDWSHFGGFSESGRQFVLLDNEGNPSVVVPKRGLPDPDLIPVCRALLAEYLAAPSPAGPAPADGPAAAPSKAVRTDLHADQ